MEMLQNLEGCAPGIIFATLAAMSVVKSAMTSWSALIGDIIVHAIGLYIISKMCKAGHTTMLWVILFFFAIVPMLMTLGTMLKA